MKRTLSNQRISRYIQHLEYQEYEKSFFLIKNLRKLLNDNRSWEGLNTKVNWSGNSAKDDVLRNCRQILIMECFYLIWVYLNKNSQDTISLAQIYRWLFEIYKNPVKKTKDQSEEYELQDPEGWKEYINNQIKLDEQEKKIFAGVIDMLTKPNPLIWLEFDKYLKKNFLIKGEHFDALSAIIIQESDQEEEVTTFRYKAPSDLPKRRQQSGKRTGELWYNQIQTKAATEKVFEILERRHLWLKSNAYGIAQEMTKNDETALRDYQKKIRYQERIKEEKKRLKENNLNLNYQKIEFDVFEPEEIQTLKKLRKNELRQKFLLYKLKYFSKTNVEPLYNRYYSQSSGRIQSKWLHPGDISEKAGNHELPGGVRQAIFCANREGIELAASDCNASAWQLVSLLFSDEVTKQVACGSHSAPGDFNSTMTEEALKGDYFVKEKIQTEEGRKNARTLVKKLLMTVLYGSKANQQYLEAGKLGLDGYWQPPQEKTEQGEKIHNGAYRFLKACEAKYPVLKFYVPLMQTVAKIASEQALIASQTKSKYGAFAVPYIFESNAWLNFDHPLMEAKTLKFSRNHRSKEGKIKRICYSFTLQVPKSTIFDGRFVEVDIKKVKKALPPLLIQSIDSGIIKHLTMLLDQKLPPNYGFATIHDCVLYPKDVITRDEVQQLWNESLRLTYQQFGTLLNFIVGTLAKDRKKAGKYYHIALSAYEKWQKNVQNQDFLNSLWLSTSDDWETEESDFSPLDLENEDDEEDMEVDC